MDIDPRRSAPLQGILVLDLTRAVAGPFCTMCLADLGARVIKIEEPQRGDESRHWGPPFIDGDSAYFHGLNRNKESVTLDLKQPDDIAILRRLVCRADVLIENFRPGVADRLGIGPDEVLVENPRLIYASISGFGQTGPDRSRPGYDLIVQALSGLMQVSAATGGPPVKVGFPIADILAGLFTGQGILAALHDRLLTGQGRRVEVSLLEALLASMCSVTSTYLLTGQEPAPMGTGQSNIVPYQAFECQDGPIVVGVPNERIWQRFCEALDRMDWLEDERYRGNGARNRHRADLVVEIEQTMRSRPRAEWLRKLEACEVPCAPILSIQQIFQHPQVSARHVAVEVKHPAIGAMRLVGSPMRLSGHATFYRPPPRLGEHTQDVLRELLADTADPEAARSRSRDHDCS